MHVQCEFIFILNTHVVYLQGRVSQSWHTWHWGPGSFHYGGCPAHCQLFSGIPDLFVEAAIPSSRDDKNVSRHRHMSPGTQNCSRLRTPGLVPKNCMQELWQRGRTLQDSFQADPVWSVGSGRPSCGSYVGVEVWRISRGHPNKGQGSPGESLHGSETTARALGIILAAFGKTWQLRIPTCHFGSPPKKNIESFDFFTMNKV